LSTKFKAAVDATNWDISFENIQSHFLRTSVLSMGSVTGHPGQHGKTAELEMTVDDGRIDDLLRLFAEQDHPSMRGRVKLHARVNLPAGSPGFLKRLNLEGEFGIGGGRLMNAQAQVPIDRLSESARGESKQQEAEDPQTVLSDLKGHVSVKDGIATLSNISFTAPGTFAQIRGTYNLLNNAINLEGILDTKRKALRHDVRIQGIRAQRYQSVPEKEVRNRGAIHDYGYVGESVIRAGFRRQTALLVDGRLCDLEHWVWLR